MQRAVLVCSGEVVEAWHLGLQSNGWHAAPPLPGMSGAPGTTGAAGTTGDEADTDYARSKQRTVEEFQRQFVHRALESAKGNISRAASACGLTRAALQRIMRQLEIEREDYQ